jgi:energy-coupling factor transporter ATP-binding protein EcfA2
MRLYIRNFRSIKEQEIELAPITLVYGPNGTGKSSLLYALLTLKILVSNPNQQPPGFFNYQFTSLGGLREVIFDHNISEELEIGIAFEYKGFSLNYRVTLKDAGGTFIFDLDGPEATPAHLRLPVAFPYPGNQQTQETLSWKDREFTLFWNGLVFQAQPKESDPEAHQDAALLTQALNAPVECLRRVSFVPLRRGFNQPTYSVSAVSPLAIADTEVASLLAGDKDLEYRVSFYLEGILNRELRVRGLVGTGLFSLDCVDKRIGLGVEVVNDGFGVNQLVYLLAKALYKDAGLVGIEEPEIHLHPTAVRSLAQAMVRMVHEEEKQLVISTHSEPLVTAFLSLVAQDKLSPAELACYLAIKDKKTSRFERQTVNEKGQIEGGLGSFMEGELEEIKAFLGLH